MEPENLQTRLGVWIVCRLETQLVDTHLCKENLHEPYQTAEREAKVRDDPFYLMELRQMCCINSLVSKDPVDREVTGWSWIYGELMKHVSRDGCSVGT